MNELEKIIINMLEPHQLMSMATLTEDGKPWVRYVTGQLSDGITVQIATFCDSRKVKQIRKNPEVHLTCGVTKPEESNGYLQIAGIATVSTAPEDKRKLWHEGLKDYFNDVNDPRYCVITVTPYRIEYMAPGAIKPRIWPAEM